MVHTSFQQHANVNMNLTVDAWISLGYTYIYAHTFFFLVKNILWDTPFSVYEESSNVTY